MPGTTRERIVAAATRLFAERGYASTSVADIQQACGLTGGSGALYKHFPSKRALLEAVVDGHVDSMRAGQEAFATRAGGGPHDVLRWTAEAVRAAMQRDRDALRVLLRDLDEHPDLLARMWSQVRANVYDEFAAWLQAASDRGEVRVSDAYATAAVLLAALTAHPILDALIGHPPGDVEWPRFAATWVEHAERVLTA